MDALRIIAARVAELSPSPEASVELKDTDQVRSRNDLLDIPDIRQYNDYSCGSACLLAILTYFGVYDGREEELGALLGTTPADGTQPSRIVEVAKKFGIEAEPVEGCSLDDLRLYMKQKRPVILNFQAWKESPVEWSHADDDGHYAILIGMDDTNLYMRDPSIHGRIGKVPCDEFMERWHDTGLEGSTERLAIVFDATNRPAVDLVQEIK